MGVLGRAINETPDKTKSVTIAGKFVVEVRWINPKQREQLVQKCTERGTFGQLNLGKFSVAMSRAVIAGWSGLTVDVLVGPLGVCLHESAIADLVECEKKNGGQIPYDPDDAANLWRQAKSSAFSDKISDVLDTWEHDELAAEVAKLKKASV